MANILTLSPEGAKFIQNFEGFRDKPYQDSGGLWTIGYGEKLNPDELFAYKDIGITQEDAQSLFDGWIAGYVSRLRKCPLALLQHQFDACCSLAYNIGLKAFLDSTIYKNLAMRSIDIAPWLEWTHDAKGKVDEGLTRRRRAELKLFIYGLYS